MGSSSTRRAGIVLVGVVVLLVAGAVGWGAIGTESTGGDSPAADGERAELQDGGDGNETDGNQTDENESVVTANQTIEAFQAVENRTNGTAFGARLSGEVGDDLDQSEFVYEVDVLADNGSHLVAEIYAANATVIGVESANDSDGVFAELFGSNDDVPDEARNTSELRSASDAVRLAANETDSENQTVTQVALETRDDELFYRVQQFEPGGERREVLVAATSDDEDAVTTDPQSSRRLLA